MLKADPKRTQAQTVATLTRGGRFVPVKDKPAPIDGGRAQRVRDTYEDDQSTIEPACSGCCTATPGGRVSSRPRLAPPLDWFRIRAQNWLSHLHQ